MNSSKTPAEIRTLLIERSKNLPTDLVLFKNQFIQGLYETIKQRIPVYGAVTYAKLAEFAELAARTDFRNSEEVDRLYYAIQPFTSSAENMTMVPAE